MKDLSDDIVAFDKMREELEQKYTGKWVLFYDQKLISIFDSFESAAQVAVEKFGNGPYLIRQVGARPIVLPSSLLFRIGYA
jgi:hypothetical protein